MIAQLAARWGAQVYATAADANNHQQLKEAAYIVHAFLDDGTGFPSTFSSLELL